MQIMLPSCMQVNTSLTRTHHHQGVIISNIMSGPMDSLKNIHRFKFKRVLRSKISLKQKKNRNMARGDFLFLF